MQKSREDTDVLNVKGFRGTWKTTALTAVQEWMGKTMHEESKVDYFVMKREARFGDFTNYEVVKRIPSADVAPVKHGRWVDVDRMQMHDLHGVLTWGNSFKCTECQFKTFAVEGHITQYKYCPNCGAKMDEK